MKKLLNKLLISTVALGSVAGATSVVAYLPSTNHVINNSKIESSQNVGLAPGPTQESIAFVNDAVDRTNKSQQAIIPVNTKEGVTFDNKAASWYDEGFTWYELLNRPWYKSDGSADTSKTYLDKVLEAQKMFNLGFITAADPEAVARKVQAEPNNVYAKVLQYELGANPGLALPSIAGNLSPLILNNAVNWDGSQRTSFLDQIRKHDGDYKLSFGGWNNYTIAGQSAKDSSDKTKPADYVVKHVYEVYKNLVTMTGATNLDFDIEGAESGAVDDWGHTPLTPQEQVLARNIRIEALTKLKADFPSIKISWTLPTQVSGINQIDKDMLINAGKAGLVDQVNTMSFDFGLSDKGVSPDKRITTPGESALYAISSANANHEFLMKDLGFSDADAWKKLGITIMAGRQDVQKQETWITDAQIITNYAIDHKIGMLANWSINRDLSQFVKNDYSKAMKVDDWTTYPAAEGYNGTAAKGYPYPFYTGAVSSADLLNYKNEVNPKVGDTVYQGTYKTIEVGGKTYDINAAMVDSLDTKDFAYTNVINNFNSGTKYKVDNHLINGTVLKYDGKQLNATTIENFTGILPSTGINVSVGPKYQTQITLERSNTEYYVSNPDKALSSALFAQLVLLSNEENVWRA